MSRKYVWIYIGWKVIEDYTFARQIPLDCSLFIFDKMTEAAFSSVG